MAIRKTVIAIVALAWGCTPQAYIHEVHPDHPAGPSAPQGMLPGPSRTLAIEDRPMPEGEGRMPHDAESGGRMNHGTHRAGGAEAGSPQGDEALYQCPMHPEVTSGDPERRCPKCNMKINKPVKGEGSTPGHEGHGGHSQ